MDVKIYFIVLIICQHFLCIPEHSQIVDKREFFLTNTLSINPIKIGHSNIWKGGSAEAPELEPPTPTHPQPVKLSVTLYKFFKFVKLYFLEYFATRLQLHMFIRFFSLEPGTVVLNRGSRTKITWTLNNLIFYLQFQPEYQAALAFLSQKGACYSECLVFGS